MKLPGMRSVEGDSAAAKDPKVLPFRRSVSLAESHALQRQLASGVAYEMGIDSFFGASHFMRPNGALHTHSFRVQAIFRAESVDDRGMMFGFRAVTEVLESEAKKYANSVLNEVEPFVAIEPTGENLAVVILRSLETKLANDVAGAPELVAVTLWENPTSFIRVTPTGGERWW